MLRKWLNGDEIAQLYGQKNNAMIFGLAIEAMKKGAKVARAGWNGKGMWIMYAEPETETYTLKEGTFARLPYIYMKTANDELVPWLASQTDMLAEDWMVVNHG